MYVNMKNLDKIKYLNHINEFWLEWLDKLWIEINLFNKKFNVNSNKPILEDLKWEFIYYILKKLNTEWLIKENLNFFEMKNRFNITDKWEYFLEKNKKIYNKVELYALDYPFFSSLIIWFFWWLSATLLNIFFH